MQGTGMVRLAQGRFQPKGLNVHQLHLQWLVLMRPIDRRGVNPSAGWGGVSLTCGQVNVHIILPQDRIAPLMHHWCHLGPCTYGGGKHMSALQSSINENNREPTNIALALHNQVLATKRQPPPPLVHPEYTT